MKKLLVLVLIFLTGCTAQYEMKINLDSSIEEKTYVFDYQNAYREKVTIENMNDTFKYGHSLHPSYKIEKIANDDIFGAKLKNNFKNIKIYQKNTSAFKYLYKNLKVSTSNKLITLETEGKVDLSFISNNTFDTPIIPKDCYIAIKLPFKVIKNNADKVLKNIYYWYYDENSANKTISITYDKSKLSTYNPIILFTYLPILYKEIVIGIIVALILCLIVFAIYKKAIENNRL